MNKLLGSYFGEDIMLIPLGEQDWRLFLSDEQIVTGEAEEDTLEAKRIY